MPYSPLKILGGHPIVKEACKPLLARLLFQKVNGVGRIRDREESIFMPMDDGTGFSKG